MRGTLKEKRDSGFVLKKIVGDGVDGYCVLVEGTCKRDHWLVHGTAHHMADLTIARGTSTPPGTPTNCPTSPTSREDRQRSRKRDEEQELHDRELQRPDNRAGLHQRR